MRLYFLFLSLLTITLAKAGDTVKITNPIPISFLDSATTADRYIINGKSIIFPFTPYNGPFQYLQVNDGKAIEFDNSFLGIYSPAIPYRKEPTRSNPLLFGNCNINYLDLAFLSGDVTVYNSKIGVLSYDSAAGGQLLINGSHLNNVVVLWHAKNISLDCQYTYFTDTAVIKTYDSHVYGFNFAYDTVGGSTFEFARDSISKSVVMYASAFGHPKGKDTSTKPNSFYFYNCYIDASFVFFEEVPRSAYYFYGCTFGPNADLSQFSSHKVVFRSCKFPGSSFPIDVHSSTDSTYLSFINTNLDNVRINYTPDMRLWFDTSDSRDQMENTYVQLIDKFKKEGKSASLEVVDIQYRQFKDSKFLSRLENLWWNYGYDRFRVFWWTLIAIFLFAIINTIFWNRMQQTYPIIPRDNAIYFRSRFHRRIIRIVNPFLFTVFIFFSLRIDFGILNFQRIRWVGLFLIQYALGVWCLFFIARAILTF